METKQSSTQAELTTKFQGFQQLDATFVFCPNQFLDLCITTQSKPVVRLVGHVLYETLKWLDKDGQPQSQDIATPFSKLVAEAGISRGAIRPAIDDAMCSQFLRCVQQPKCGSAHQSPTAGEYRLKWAESSTYAKELSDFDGFYRGEGNRTPIPHDYFTTVIRHESLAVIRVVAAVIRHTIGYANQFGGRKHSSPLSHRFIQRWSGIQSSSTMNSALQIAMSRGYIVRTKEGSCQGIQAAAHYALNWHSEAEKPMTSSKIEAGEFARTVSPEAVQKTKSDQFTNRSEGAVQKPQQGKEHIQIKHKQQSVAVGKGIVSELEAIGFDAATAKLLAKQCSSSVIRQQIEWLPLRDASRNKLGLLRKAIEQDWERPVESDDAAAKLKSKQARQRSDVQAQQRAIEVAAADQKKQQRRDRKKRLLSEWQRLSMEQLGVYRQRAIADCSSVTLRNRLRLQPVSDTPPTEFLDAMATDLGLPTVVPINGTPNNMATVN